MAAMTEEGSLADAPQAGGSEGTERPTLLVCGVQLVGAKRRVGRELAGAVERVVEQERQAFTAAVVGFG